MLVLGSDDVTRLLDIESCIAEIEKAFRARGEGRLARSSVAGLELTGGGLHAKLGVVQLSRAYAAAKINANFPENPRIRGLPTIQGLVVLFDAASGVPLACMDSSTLTAARTAAASAVAARYLALPGASSVAIIGCGIQARAHASALCVVRPIRRVILFDSNRDAAEKLAHELWEAHQLEVTVADSLGEATLASEIVVTLTTSRSAFLDVGDVNEGTFIAAVGADNEHKQEIAPALLRAGTVIVDDLDQCCRIGDLHHALDAGVMRRQDVRASLDQVVAGIVAGRRDDREIVIFDSTGVAIEDVAAAAIVYERAEKDGTGLAGAISHGVTGQSSS
ncbi:MAG TPA: ornithine cyclodeaminase family protein [Gemmatimonadaceae bacterium]|nr:ornithine cyclodeaminase family protein [Gemmatimonadaceae bacterium]